MDIDAKDCRLEGISNAVGTSWLRGTYLPIGVVVEREVELSPKVANEG